MHVCMYGFDEHGHEDDEDCDGADEDDDDYDDDYDDIYGDADADAYDVMANGEDDVDDDDDFEESNEAPRCQL